MSSCAGSPLAARCLLVFLFSNLAGLESDLQAQQILCPQNLECEIGYPTTFIRLASALARRVLAPF
jgi:hypothetical protein